MREQIRIAYSPPAKPAWDSDGRKRRSGLRQMPASYREQGSPEVQSNGHQIKEAERQLWAAVPRNRPDSKKDAKGDERGYMEYVANQATLCSNMEEATTT